VGGFSSTIYAGRHERRKSESATLTGMPPQRCRVRFKDLSGQVHDVEVVAGGLHEAAALGLRALESGHWLDAVGPGTKIHVEGINPPAVRFLMVGQLKSWLDGGGGSPSEAAMKLRLKRMLARPADHDS
jgi:hypothetical protein